MTCPLIWVDDVLSESSEESVVLVSPAEVLAESSSWLESSCEEELVSVDEVEEDVDEELAVLVLLEDESPVLP